MNDLSSYCRSALRKLKQTQNKDEILPFAHIEGRGELEKPELDTDQGFQEGVGDRAPVKRRNTVCGIEKATISAWDAGWNVSNAIQGMFVLGLPISIRDGGFLGVLVITLAAVLCYYTGKILVHCLYERKDNKTIRVHDSYSDVAVRCWGRFGGHVVNATQLIELLMTCVLYIVVSANLMKSSFPNLPVSETAWSILTSLVLFCCVLLRDLKAVSKLSMGCSVVQFVVLGITMFYCLINISNWKWHQLTFQVNLKKFPISIGVIVFSYTSQIFLPTLEGSMEKRKEFPKMLCWSYVASCLIKEFFALFCFLMWGEKTKDVVTDNLPGLLRVSMNTMLVVKALLSYPLPYYQSIEIFEQSVFTNATGGWGSFLGTKSHPYSTFSEDNADINDTSFSKTASPTSDAKRLGIIDNITEKSSKTVLNDSPKARSCNGFPSCYNAEGKIQNWALVLRAAVVLGTLVMAIFIPHFALLMGFTGNLTGTLLAFLLPCAFHLQLKRKDMTWYQVLLDLVIMMLGFMCAVIGLYYSAVAFQTIKSPSHPIMPAISNATAQSDEWFPDFPEKAKEQN